MKAEIGIALLLLAAPAGAQVVLTPAAPVVVRAAAGVTITPSPNGRVSISGLGISGTVELVAPVPPAGTVDSSSLVQFPTNVNFQIRQSWSAGAPIVTIEGTATGRCTTNLDTRNCEIRSLGKESSGLAILDADIQLVAPGSSSFPTSTVRFRWSTGGCPAADFVPSRGGQGRATTAPGCAAGAIASISPSVASNDPTLPYANAGAPGAIRAVITGTGLPQNGTVSLGPGITVQNVVFKSQTEIEASLSGFANVPEGPRDVVVTSAAGARITGTGLFFVSSLVLKDIEINQGVPLTCAAAMPCLAQHNTVVRVRMECNGVKADGQPCEIGKEAATGRLNVFRNGGTLVLSPYQPRNPMRVLRSGSPPTNQRLQNAEDGLNFYFTEGNIGLLPDGAYRFHFEIDPRTPSRAPTATADAKALLSQQSDQFRSLEFFKSNRAPSHLNGSLGHAIGGIRIALLLDPADTAVVTPDVLLRWMGFVRAVYPASGDSIQAEVVPNTIAWAGEEELTLANVSSGFAQTAADGSPFTHLFYFTTRTNQPGLSQCGEGRDSKIRNYWNCWDRGSVVQIGPARGENAMGSIAHEIGHHYYLGDSYSFQPDHNPGLPMQTSDPLCVFLDDGCPVEPGHMDTILGTVSVAGLPSMSQAAMQSLVKRDFMGSAGRTERWVNLFNWSYLYPFFNDPPPIQTGEAGRETSAAEPVELINVRGGIGAAGNVEFAPAIRTRGVPPGAPPPEAEALAEYRIEIQDGSGQTLAAVPYQPVFKMVHRAAPLERAAINETLPFPVGAARIVVKKGGSILAGRPVSPNPPTVQLVAPSAGAALDGKVRVSWSGADLDGDSLTYTVLYSKNGGTGWIPVAVNIAASEFELDTALLPGSRDGRLRVIANDGVHSSAPATGGPLTVTAKRPSVSITAPDDGAIFEQGQRVTITSVYWDHQDGQEGGTVAIRSDRDGVLGRERSVVAGRLSPGRHRITVAVTNSHGLSAEASITITVNASPDGPRIDSLVPPQAAPGATVVISGANFSATPAQNAVRFGGMQAAVTSSTATRIETSVPRGLAAGAAAVTVTVGTNSSAPADFNVLGGAGGGGTGTLVPVTPLIARGWPNERNFDNPPANAVDGNTSTFTWTTNPNNIQFPSYFGVDFGASKAVSRIRIFKDNDGGGGTLSDPFKNLTIEYTTTSPATALASRTWTRVTGLTNGYEGTELLTAQAVNADGSVTRDSHNSFTSGWASLAFTAVNATGIRIGFSNITNSTFFNHYKVHEFEAYGPAPGVGGAGTLEFSLNGIDAGGRVNFLAVNVGQTAAVTLTARNPGTAAVTVNSVSSSNPVFGGAPQSFTAASGGTAQFSVSFAPVVARAEQGVLTLNLAGGGTIALNLSGSGVAPTGGGGSATGPNLLQNGGGDAAPAAGCQTPTSIPGWSSDGRVALCSYATGGGYPTAADPGPPSRGPNFFGGGSVAASSMSQVVSLASNAAPIDAGSLPYTLSAYLGGYAGDGDAAKVTLTFLNQSGSALGASAVIGPVTPADRAGRTGLFPRSSGGNVPAGARSARVTVEFTRVAGESNDGYADEISLIVGSGGGTGGGGGVPAGGCPSTVNIARTGAATQSSTAFNGPASLGNNGIINEPNGYGFHTDIENAPWWQVDLGAVSTICEVRLYSRYDFEPIRSRTIRILLSTNGTDFDTAYAHDGSIWGTTPAPFVITGQVANRQARYVRLQLAERTYLHMREVEVYGGGSTGGGGTGGGTGGVTSATLLVDNGNLTLNAGITSGGTAYFANRLTPPSYPATLRSVLVFFPRGELPVGTAVSVLAAPNPSGAGGPLLAGLNFQRTASSIPSQGTFAEIAVPPLTISSGDFVVGFSSPNPFDLFPAALERESGSKQRSYISSDGNNFVLIDATAIGGGNFGIRARIDLGAGTGGGGSGAPAISVSPASLDFGSVAVGQIVQRPVTIRNTGSARLTVAQISVPGPVFSVFATGIPWALEPGESREFQVRFSPTGAARQTAQLIIASDDPNQRILSIDLAGSGSASTVSTAIVPRGVAGWPNGRNFDNPPSNAIDGNTNTFTWTTNPFNNSVPSYLGLDFGATVNGVNRLRLYKDPDGGGGTLADNSKNLTIEYTTSDPSLPLSARTWTTVTGLINGFGGAELLNATAVNAGGTVAGDVHDSRVSGWASLTFSAVNATGIRIGFTNPRGISTLYNHYKVHEIQALR